jgi:prepilin-type N-terminal cleavage/methylation domain-containing protein/prepilin-type processing-associated H-X9-DG protein
MVTHTHFGARHRPQRAFTLVEMLVVLLILGLLVAMAIPLGTTVLARGRQALCKNNLRQLGVIFLSDKREMGHDPGASMLPGAKMTASRWLDAIYDLHDKSAAKLLLCPDGQESDPLQLLDRLWIRQYGHSGSANEGIFHSNIGALLDGAELADWQVGALYRGKVYGYLSFVNADFFVQRNGGELKDNEIYLAVDSCAAMKITIDEEKETFTITSFLGSNIGNSGSDHFVLYGDGDYETWQDNIVVRLTGRSYGTVHEPQVIGMLARHYGMNNLVHSRRNRPRQLWMTEYSDEIIQAKPADRDDPFDGDLTNGELQARHRGQANYLTVDGAVSHATREELEMHFEMIDDPDFESLFDH